MSWLLGLPMYAGATTIYLTSGTSWIVPSDWNSSDNTIEVIGGGANGVAGSTGGTGTTGGMPSGSGGSGGAGGGGGAYSKSTNVTLSPGVSVTYAVGGVSSDSYLCSSTSNCASISGTAVIVGAKGASGTSGGAAASGVGGTKYNGGNGASGSSGSATGNCNGGAGGAGGGGGGAAGLHGAGSNGSGSSGGTGDAGNTAAGANGTQWSASYGSGGGAAGGTTGGTGGSGDCTSYKNNGSSGAAGSAGGTYGAGGSGGKGGGGGSAGYTVTISCDKWGCTYDYIAGGSGGTGGSSGAGRQGLIVITYTAPLPSAGRDLAVTVPITVNANVSVSANLSKGSGTFLIDHPLDPKNKLLYHSFVESPDVLNEYTGTAHINDNGEATIVLPHYFEALNKDYQYFIRPIDKPMPNLYIKEEVQNNRFVVGGGSPGGTISWMVTGVRQDPYILANPIVPEVEKGPSKLINKGEYLFEGNAPTCSTIIGCVWQFLIKLF